jgi:hypothetical protein
VGTVIGAPSRPVYVGVHVAPEVRRAIDDRAREEHSSRAAVVRRVLTRWAAENDDRERGVR